MSCSSSSGRHRQVVLGLPVFDEELFRDAVDVHVRRLGREHDGDQQLDIAAEVQRDLGVGVLLREPLDDRPDPLAPGTEAAVTGLADVASSHPA